MVKMWRGYRPLVLGGRRFRWACHFHYPIEVLSAAYGKRGSTWRPDTLVVRPEDSPQRLLSVTWPACYGPVLKPGFVREVIEEALHRGWLTEHPDLRLEGSELATADAHPPNHDLVVVVRDIVAGMQPRNPRIRTLD